MKTFLISVFFVFFIEEVLFSQNLVPNGSFEDIVRCPDNAQQLDRTRHWYSAQYYNSIDLFSSCDPSSQYSVPKNIGGFQYANSGRSYIGIAFYANIQNYREYVAVKLLESLKNAKNI